MTNTPAIPPTFAATAAQVADACGGGVPCRVTPDGLSLALWAFDGIDAKDIAAWSTALGHWALRCGFVQVGDVTRAIQMQPPIFPRSDA